MLGAGESVESDTGLTDATGEVVALAVRTVEGTAEAVGTTAEEAGVAVGKIVGNETIGISVSSEEGI
jgi:hypothetical protein